MKKNRVRFSPVRQKKDVKQLNQTKFSRKVLSLACLMNVYIFYILVYHKIIPRMEGRDMATNKRVFTLRLSDEVFDKIGVLATNEHRSMTNYIEYVLIQHLEQIEKEHGKIKTEEK